MSILFRWSNLRSLSNSYATRSAVLIPIFGYVLLFNGKVSEWLDVVTALGGSQELHGVSIRLLMIYFGLCFIAAANVLYGFYCPDEVKAFPTANSYIVGEGDSIKHAALEAIGDALKRSDFALQYRLLDDEYQISKGVNDGVDVERKNMMLRMYFDYLNSRHRSVRITSAVAYIIGFAFIGAPSLQVFYRVIMLVALNIAG